jgi:hypothetical protein
MLCQQTYSIDALFQKLQNPTEHISPLHLSYYFVGISIKQPTLNPIGVMAQKGQSFIGM